MNKIRLFFCVLIFSILNINAQNEDLTTISGNVYSLEDPVVFATIQLLDLDSNVVTGAYTDAEGSFSINHGLKGICLLKISSIEIQDTVLLVPASKNVKFGQIRTKPSDNTLNSVEIIESKISI